MKKLEKNGKKYELQKGITLIALVVTIIVLLILAGVAINLTVGNNGIFSRAKNASNIWREAEKNEADEMQSFENTYDETLKNLGLDGKEIANLFTFTIDAGDDGKYEYQAEKGMTWSDWINSKYNIDECFMDEGVINGEKRIHMLYKVSYIEVIINSFDDEINETVYNGEYAGSLSECVSGNSNILVSQKGKTVLAKELNEGDEIAYYNFEIDKVEIGKVLKKYIHEKATNFVKYEFDDGSYIEATDYHPIYAKDGWKSLTKRNGYEKPCIGEEIKTISGWKRLANIETWTGEEDYYDFKIKNQEGKIVDNYFANGTLVQSAYKK